MVEAPRGNDHGWRRACPEAKLGSPAPCCAPLIAERPQNRLGSGLEFRSQALAKEVKRGHVKRDHEGDVNLPKSRDNWRPPPMPPTPIYTHPYIKRRDWSLKGKRRLPGVGDDQGVGGTGEQGGADGDTAQHPPRKVSRVTKIQHHPQTSSHRDHGHQTHTDTSQEVDGTAGCGQGRRVLVASLSCGPCCGDGEGARGTHMFLASPGERSAAEVAGVLKHQHLHLKVQASPFRFWRLKAERI